MSSNLSFHSALIVVLILCLGASAVAETPPTLEDFLAEERIRDVVLSPDGEQIAYLLREASGSALGILDPKTGTRRERMRSKLIESISWAKDGSGIFIEAEERIGWLPSGEGRPVWIARLDPALEQRFLGVDPVLGSHVLITEKRDEDDFRLLRIDSSGARSAIYESSRRILSVRSFLMDQEGRVVFVKGPDGLDQVVYRLEGDAKREVFRCLGIDACALYKIDADGRLLVRGALSEDLQRLAAVDPSTGEVETLHRDPEALADLSSVLIDPSTAVPLLANYHSDRRRLYPLVSWMTSHLERLSRRFPGRDLHLQARSEGRFWVLAETGARLQFSRYHLYDSERGLIEPLLEDERQASPALSEDDLVEQQFISYRAGDGMIIHGFVQTPRDADLSKTPMVVWPHGGPWNHFRSGYRKSAQFLVSRGYIVFEPNFRSSTGFGHAYLISGKGEFGDGRVHQDILDGMDHLLAQGIGDPERVAIMGHSFGGFSTLAALAFSPERFRAGIASAPPIDLVRAVRDMDDEQILTNGVLQKQAIRDLLVDFEDAAAVEALREKSPELRLEETGRPLLILAGGKDEKVDINDVNHYAASLSRLGKDVSFLVDDEIGHSFRRPWIGEAHLYLAERFLAHHLGGASPTTASPDLLEYVDLNLRLRGLSLEAALAGDQP